MRIYTSLNSREVTECLHECKGAGLIANSLYLLQFNEYPYKRDYVLNADKERVPRLNPYRFTIRLGSHDQCDIPYHSRDSRGRHMRKRRSWNTGYCAYNSDNTYAGTYDEWGWFLAFLFHHDRDAVCGWYRGKADFYDKTEARYMCLSTTIGDETTYTGVMYGEQVGHDVISRNGHVSDTGPVASTCWCGCGQTATSEPEPPCTCIMGNSSGITTSIMDCAYHTAKARKVAFAAV